jgi:hypothetical protein
MKIWFLMRYGDELIHRVHTNGGSVPRKGDIYTLHRDGDERKWAVVGVHRDLFPGPHPALDATKRSLSRDDPDEVHEGGEVVVVLDLLKEKP